MREVLDFIVENELLIFYGEGRYVDGWWIDNRYRKAEQEMEALHNNILDDLK